MYVPDSTAKINKCYFSSIDGNVYSYSEGAPKSASIDFGYFYDTTKIAGIAQGHSIYALNASSFAPYDLSTWIKNATIFKKANTPAFSFLTSGGALRSAGNANLSSGSTPKITALASGNLVFFKTVTGKFGCLQINFIQGNDATPTTYINVDVKIEK